MIHVYFDATVVFTNDEIRVKIDSTNPAGGQISLKQEYYNGEKWVDFNMPMDLDAERWTVVKKTIDTILTLQENL